MLYATFWKSYDEDPKTVVDITAGTLSNLQRLRFTTQLHGGFGEASFTAAGPITLNVNRYRSFTGAHGVIFDEFGRRVFEGKVTASKINPSGLDVTMAGYFADADVALAGLSYGSTVKAYTIVNDMISLVPSWAAAGPYIRTTDISIGPLDFTDDEKVADVIEKVAQYGYLAADLRPMYFAIWENRTPHFFPEPQLQGYRPKWFITKANIGDDYSASRDLREVYNKIYAMYDDEDSSSVGPTLIPTAYEDKISQAKFGVREGVYNVQQVVLATAQLMAQMFLERNAWPRQIYDFSVTGVVHHSSGTSTYPYMIRAGDTLTVLDVDYGIGNLENYYGQAGAAVSGVVMRTDYDADRNTVRLEIGSRDQTLSAIMARLGISGGIK